MVSLFNENKLLKFADCDLVSIQIIIKATWNKLCFNSVK